MEGMISYTYDMKSDRKKEKNNARNTKPYYRESEKQRA